MTTTYTRSPTRIYTLTLHGSREGIHVAPDTDCSGRHRINRERLRELEAQIDVVRNQVAEVHQHDFVGFSLTAEHRDENFVHLVGAHVQILTLIADEIVAMNRIPNRVSENPIRLIEGRERQTVIGIASQTTKVITNTGSREGVPSVSLRDLRHD